MTWESITAIVAALGLLSNIISNLLSRSRRETETSAKFEGQELIIAAKFKAWEDRFARDDFMLNTRIANADHIHKEHARQIQELKDKIAHESENVAILFERTNIIRDRDRGGE